ncbi:MAG TPA: PAS domain-containing protein [Bacteroidetes bacterium]|nr:PAS domain-containing protein [Bacteroidota bacterium]HEX03751.1 PAS domain-containing protein [Bacteroidota bacterium]
MDEIGKLAQALNRMAESCSNRTDTIKADRNKLSTILSGMTEGVVAVGLDEHVLHLNEAAGKLLGVSPLESLDKPIWQVTRVPEITEILTDSLRDGTSAQRKLLITTKLTDQSLEMDASPLHDGQGNLVGAVVVLHDVSELNRLEMVRREFVANASHELKTPITAIRGLVETLIDDEELEPAKRDRFLGKIKDQSIRLGSIVTDLLTISRLESESNETEEMSFDLCEVVQSTSSVFISTGEEQDITVKVQVPNSPIELSGDEEALRQIVSNLLDNAVKYSSTGGEVCVRLHRHDDHAILEVEDTGIGIEPKDQDRIFERFYRVDKARSRELGGTGLGLAIVKHIAQSHGGNVSLDSIPGTGSTFKVILPLAGRSA